MPRTTAQQKDELIRKKSEYSIYLQGHKKESIQHYERNLVRFRNRNANMNAFKTFQIKICSQLRTIVLFHLCKVNIANNLCDIYVTTHIE